MCRYMAIENFNYSYINMWWSTLVVECFIALCSVAGVDSRSANSTHRSRMNSSRYNHLHVCELCHLHSPILSVQILAGWNDIAYSFLVCEDGRVYEGRGWNVEGAHTLGYNSIAIGICFIGDFTNDVPIPVAIATGKNLIQCGIDKVSAASGIDFEQLTIDMSIYDWKVTYILPVVDFIYLFNGNVEHLFQFEVWSTMKTFAADEKLIRLFSLLNFCSTIGLYTKKKTT